MTTEFFEAVRDAESGVVLGDWDWGTGSVTPSAEPCPTPESIWCPGPEVNPETGLLFVAGAGSVDFGGNWIGADSTDESFCADGGMTWGDGGFGD